MMEEEDQITVACRMRPASSNEFSSAKSFVNIENERKIVIESRVDQKAFTFDYIANAEVSQENFFENTGTAASQACLEGFNGTVIFYGKLILLLIVLS